jgi:hypothetical protein
VGTSADLQQDEWTKAATASGCNRACSGAGWGGGGGTSFEVRLRPAQIRGRQRREHVDGVVGGLGLSGRCTRFSLRCVLRCRLAHFPAPPPQASAILRSWCCFGGGVLTISVSEDPLGAFPRGVSVQNNDSVQLARRLAGNDQMCYSLVKEARRLDIISIVGLANCLPTVVFSGPS